MRASTPLPLARDEPTYSRSVFEAILKGMDVKDTFSDSFVCSEEGVRLKRMATDGPLQWHPFREVMAPGSPNPLDEPWLRFPFTARRLAAFMTDGWGYFIRDRYGDWEDGPDEEVLRECLGLLDGKAEEALRAAYAAYRHALTMAPPLDEGLEASASGLAKEYETAREAAIAREALREHRDSDADYTSRLAKVNEAVADLGLAMRKARETADEARERWRRAVVQHLLLPIEDVPAEAFGCLLLRTLPADRRAEAFRQLQSQGTFDDSPEGKALWALMDEISGVEREIRYWQQFNAQNITEAGRRQDEINERNARLANLNAQMIDIERSGVGKRPSAGARMETEIQRQQRRLAGLRALGGDWVKRGASWGAMDRQSGAFRKLVEQEQRNGSLNSSEKSVRRDLHAAAEAEAETKRSGVMFGGLTVP